MTKEGVQPFYGYESNSFGTILLNTYFLGIKKTLRGCERFLKLVAGLNVRADQRSVWNIGSLLQSFCSFKYIPWLYGLTTNGNPIFGPQCMHEYMWINHILYVSRRKYECSQIKGLAICTVWNGLYRQLQRTEEAEHINRTRKRRQRRHVKHVNQSIKATA